MASHATPYSAFYTQPSNFSIFIYKVGNLGKTESESGFNFIDTHWCYFLSYFAMHFFAFTELTKIGILIAVDMLF